MIDKQGSFGFLAVIAIPAWLTNEPLGTDKALRAGFQGAGLRQELGGYLAFVLLTVQQQSNARVIAGPPGQGRGCLLYTSPRPRDS